MRMKNTKAGGIKSWILLVKENEIIHVSFTLHGNKNGMNSIKQHKTGQEVVFFFFFEEGVKGRG